MPRFERVHTDYHGRLGLPVGVFVAVDHLRRAGRLTPDDEALWLAIDDWFVAHLPEPPQYADGNSLGVITWFKTPVPALMQRRVDVATRLLSKYGVAWSVSASDAPGEVVYEDEYQVAVVPPVRGEPSAPPAGLVLGPTTSGSKQALASEESAVARRHLAYYATELGDRATRTLHANRSRQLAGFIEQCRSAGLRSVLEVGCGGGGDGVVLQDAGLDYRGVDLTPEAIDICTDRGLSVMAASASDLPFEEDSFDALWTMSTLMHLDGDGFDRAVAEVGRVVRPGGLASVGLWGSEPPARRIDEHGRLFVQRSDVQVREAFSRIGSVDTFEVSRWYGDGAHYQFLAVRVG